MDLIWGIFQGVAAGITYALTGFAKKSDEAFDYTKFGATIGVGVVTGLIITFANIPIDAAYLYMMNVGATSVIENLLKAIYKKFSKK